MKKEKIKAIIFSHSGGFPIIQRITLKNALETFQRFVDGYIEVIRLKTFSGKVFDLICNEEGKLRDFEISAFIVFDNQIVDTINGPFLIVDADNEGNFIDCPEFCPDDILFYEGLPVFTYA